ncbi:MAG: ABC transporter ATP-binding protein [Candidatus Bipolaricaulota bacterium]
MNAVTVEHLDKVYGRGQRAVRAVDGVSFSVDSGELVGLLGANGAGKTTIIKIICGLLLPTGGSAAVYGVPTDQKSVARYVAAVLEGSRNIYWRLSVEENLRFFAGLVGQSPRAAPAHIQELVSLLGLMDKRRVVANNLSQGMKQKLAIACALVRNTSVLLLDEPTLGLDVETSYEVRGLIRELAEREGRTVLLSSHDMGVVESVCRRVIIVARGRVVTDDQVGRLLNLFRTRALRVALSGVLDKQALSRLQEEFPGVRVCEDSGAPSLDVELEVGQTLYQLIDVLRTCGVGVEEVARVEPKLEEVFLRVVRGENGAGKIVR